MQYPVLYEVLHLYYQPCKGKKEYLRLLLPPRLPYFLIHESKGMLWYQGETDSAYERPAYYKDLLTKLVEQYRAAFGALQLPVILVQLCPFETEPFDFKVIREIQRRFADEDENGIFNRYGGYGPDRRGGRRSDSP